MNTPQLWLLAILVVPMGVVADNTGPTHPESSREHPLDNRPLDERSPRQEIIEPPQRRDAAPQPGSDDSLPPTPEPPSTPADRHNVPVPRFEAAGGELPWPPGS